MSTDVDVNFEPLPGYRLIEHIGTGGYGEVWRAEAPGGLTKAIKFVFGQQHEKRATNELRALDHVRSVRHPFLLSLERIEVVDGRLIVVTELADGSLKDRFDVCRREGLHGIPRGELLNYLRDAADALDFMGEAHTLQHLDIKPENLLILAGHVKVADFGLVKDVRQSQASLVGGMTPLYAAPEVFRGTPSCQSDQYSLAIVYQEMLTGALPFVGSNAAELTLQHLNDEPDLSSLSVSDRYAVSRALSKDPQHRYSNCREFVESLSHSAMSDGAFDAPGPQTADHVVRREFGSGAARPCVPTDVFEDQDSPDWGQSQPLLVEVSPVDRAVSDLPPVDVSGCDARPIPTVVIGIGGTAGRVLSHFRTLVHERCGEAAVPSVQLLLLDTDSRALSQWGARDKASLTQDEMLSLPLRRPQHYRDHSQQLLGWLSRRWLYNIPRTLRTEGLRPLGRLALADHSRQAGQRIRRAIAQTLDSGATAASSQALGSGFRNDAVRVFVVASISGGTGGGMSLDVGYAVRTILSKLGMQGAHLCGVMMHSTGGDPRSCELARVNALSWLTEFHHFQQSSCAYPGDASCGLPAHAAEVPAFDSTYLVHLGENLNEVDFDQSAQLVAEYLRLNVLTPAGAFFDACRAPGDTAKGSVGGPARSLRSFGLYHRAAAPSEFCDEFAGVVSQQVLASWRNTEDAPARATKHAAELHSQTNHLVDRLKFDAAGIAANSRALLEFELGGNATAVLSKTRSTTAASKLNVLECIDRLFAADAASDDATKNCSLRGKPLADVVAPLAEKMRQEICRWALALVDDRRSRLGGARQGIAWLADHCRAIDVELQQRRSLVAGRLFELKTSGECGDMEAQYFALQLDRAAVLAAEHTVHLILCDAKQLSEELTAVSREVDQVATAVSRACGDTASNLANGTIAQATTNANLAKRLRAILPQLAAAAEERLHVEYIQPQGGLMKVIMGGGRPRAQLTAKLHEVSRQAVQHALASQVSVDSGSDAGAGNASDELRSGLVAATPSLLEFGGTRRVLTMLPRDAAAAGSALWKCLGVAATTIAGQDNNLTLCVEVGQLSVEHIAASFVEYRRDRTEFAGRVHCRTDIEWTPLIDTSTSTPPVAWPGAEPCKIQSRDAMCKTLVI